MILDKQLMLSEAQAVTVSAASTNVIDIAGAARDVGIGTPLYLFVNVDVAVTAAGNATVVFGLQTDSTEAFSSAETVFNTAAIGKAALVARARPVAVALPFGMKRYARLLYTVGTGPLTAGAFTAGIALDLQANQVG